MMHPLRHLPLGAALVSLAAGCGQDPVEGTPATSLGIVRAFSSATAYEASASFYSPFVSAPCQASIRTDGCVVTQCESAPEPSPEATAGPVTIVAKETIVLSADNAFTASADRSLFLAGEEVVVHLAPTGGVPGFTVTLAAPGSTALSSPLPVADDTPLELKRAHSLLLTWAPAESGYMRLYLLSGLTAVSCQWALADGVALVDAGTIEALPSSDGTDSQLSLWTEQSTTIREDQYEFVVLLEGELVGSRFSGFTLD